MDVGWSPDAVDGRYYDMPALAAAADYLYVMDYDIRSQVYGRCLAGPNSPFGAASLGLRKYLQVPGLRPEQIILGVPWYGYGYTCLEQPAATGAAGHVRRALPFCGASTAYRR